MCGRDDNVCGRDDKVRGRDRKVLGPDNKKNRPITLLKEHAPLATAATATAPAYGAYWDH